MNIEFDTSELSLFASALVRKTEHDAMRGVMEALTGSLDHALAELRADLSGRVLQRRSGRLLGSANKIGPTVVGQDILAAVGITEDIPYARIHLTGGTIHPRRAQWLTIPIGPGRTAHVASARDIAGLFSIRSRTGNLLLVTKNADNSVTPWFVLKKSVTIPKRDYLATAARVLYGEAEGVVSVAFAAYVLQGLGSR